MLGAIGINGDANNCNKGDEVVCNKLIVLPSVDIYAPRFTTPYFADKLKLKAEAAKEETQCFAELERKGKQQAEANLAAAQKKQAEENIKSEA